MDYSGELKQFLLERKGKKSRPVEQGELCGYVYYFSMQSRHDSSFYGHLAAIGCDTAWLSIRLRHKLRHLARLTELPTGGFEYEESKLVEFTERNCGKDQTGS